MRKQFDLLPEDEAFLNQYSKSWEAVMDGTPWIIIHGFLLPKGYNHSTVSIAIRMTAGYPQKALDMVYAYPHVQRQDGQMIKNLEGRQQLDGKEWQQWSRHYTEANPWKPGVSNLESHIYCAEDWFYREFENVPISA